MIVLEVLFWASLALIVYAHVGYPLLLALVSRLFGRDPEPAPEGHELPLVTLIVAAYDEQDVIERKVANARELDYPRERLEIVVASDGSRDRTVELARPYVVAAQTLIRDSRLVAELVSLRDNLTSALTSRAVIDQAKGIVMAKRGCTADEAFRVLTRLSNRSNRKLRDIAAEVVELTAGSAGTEPSAHL